MASGKGTMNERTSEEIENKRAELREAGRSYEIRDALDALDLDPPAPKAKAPAKPKAPAKRAAARPR